MIRTVTIRIALLCVVTLLTLVACDEAPTGVALGTLERDRVALTATSNEIIIALPVPRGTYVKKGTVLAQLDNRSQKAIVDRRAAEVALAQANLDEKKAGPRAEDIAQARAQLAASQALADEAEDEYQRLAKVVDTGAASRGKYDASKSARDATRAEVSKNEEALSELLAGTRPEDIRKAEADVAVAEANLKEAQIILEELTVTASRDGWLDGLPWNLGERVTMGSPVAILLAGGAPYARVYVPEPYRASVSQDDQLKVSIDGVKEPIEGKVRWISANPSFTPYYALSQQDRARLMYLAEVQLPDSATELPSGVPVQVALP